MRRVASLAVAAGWASITALILSRVLAGQLLLLRLRRVAVEVGDGFLPLVQACRAALGLSRRVRLASHPAVASPIALGVLRSSLTVEIPEGPARFRVPAIAMR